MKKIMLFGFLIMFLLSATAFAGITGLTKESEKTPAPETRENKLSDEELSRMNPRAETDNLYNSDLSNNEKKDSKNNLRESKQIIVEHHHHGYYYGGGLLLIVILVIVLV